jgi:hypothetical protein
MYCASGGPWGLKGGAAAVRPTKTVAAIAVPPRERERMALVRVCMYVLVSNRISWTGANRTEAGRKKN